LWLPALPEDAKGHVQAYSPECVEGKFSEVRFEGVLRSSPHLAPLKQQQEYARWVMR